jgi:CHRD domain
MDYAGVVDRRQLKERNMSKVQRIRGMAVVLAAALVASGPLWAAAITVKLTGADETPPVKTSATGTGTITINADKTVSGRIKTSGIDGTMAHIHTGAPGESGPPIITLKKEADGVWSVPPGAALTDDQYAVFKAGKLYVNVHSAEHVPGEIRGQINP